MRYFPVCVCLFLFFSYKAVAQADKATLTIVPLGTEGGLNESNLSAYLAAPYGSDNYLCLDAGTLYSGVTKAISNHIFNKPATTVIRQNIKAYCISHPHLDHVAGLIINSPSDTTKNIYGTKFCLDRIAAHYFSWQTWANFGDAGEKPALNKYHYKELIPDTETPVEATVFFITAFTLSHSEPFESTAFLVRKDSSYLLYFGDTGADTIEHSQRLQHVWQRIAQLILAKQLKGMFIECSYPNEQPDRQLFGHLTPKLLMMEINNLASLCGKKMLLNFPIVITHMKPEGDNETKIINQLKAKNTLNLKLIFPQQGKRFVL